MPDPHEHAGTVRFSNFEIDLRAGEVWKAGRRVKLQEQPFRVLAMLVEHAGEVVTREDLRRSLWPQDTFVDFDDSINRNINKIREALGDSASHPQYVETLPKRGYRFRATIETAPPTDSPVRTLLRIAGFALTLGVWGWVNDQSFKPEWTFALAVGGPLAMVPVSHLGCRALDARPTHRTASWAAVPVHYAIMMALGSALIESVKSARASPHWIIPLPPEVGMVLSIVAGAAVALTVAGLASRRFGAPFAIYLSRHLNASRMYAWTRNPIILSLLVFWVCFGLWTRSGMFVVWVVGLVAPATVYFLKIFEERESEIRLGPFSSKS